MKKLIWIVGFCVLGSAASVYAAEERVDFHAVNPALQTLLDTVLAGDEIVDYAYPRFDESVSDLKAEKLKYDAQGSLKNTPWLDGGKADVTVTSTYGVDRTAGHTGVLVAMGSSVRTDMLAMIRYSAYLGQKKMSSPDPKFDARVRAHLKRMAVVTSLDQVYDLLVSGKQLAKEMTVDLVQKEEEWLHCLESGECHSSGGAQEELIQEQKKRIAEITATLPSYDRLQIEVVKEGGKVRQLIVSSPDLTGFLFYQKNHKPAPGAGKIVVTDASAVASTEAIFRMPVDELDKLKSDLQTRFVGVQNGNFSEKDLTQKDFRRALITFKQTIRGEN